MRAVFDNPSQDDDVDFADSGMHSGASVKQTSRWERLVADIHGATGPTLICQGGIHGNEPAGLLAAQQVAEKLALALDRQTIEPVSPIFRGRFIALTGNVAALNDDDPDLRYFDRDLNRMFFDESIESARMTPSQERTPEQHELLALLDVYESILEKTDQPVSLMDLHTVSSASPAFAYVEDSLPARALGISLGIPLVLGFEEVLHGLCIDYMTNHYGVLGVLVEAGKHDDPHSSVVHEAAIWAVLAQHGMIENPKLFAGFDVYATLAKAAGTRCKRVYDLRCRVPIGSPPMEMLDRAQAFTRVWKGLTPVGRRIEHGGEEHIVHSPADGLLFMPNRQTVRRPDDDAFFVIRPIWRRFMWLSAKLRKSRLTQRLLWMLPGVQKIGGNEKGEPITLEVDHAMAAIMARDILHLLGYRVLQSKPTPYQRVYTRLALAVWLVPTILLRVLLRRRPSSEELWIVRQHLLDCEA